MSKAEEIKTLSPELMHYLDGETLILISTIEADSDIPNVTAISWVKCYNEQKIRFSVTTNSRLLKNIQSNPHVVLSVIGLETVYSIVGKCTILEEEMSGVSLKLAKVEVDIESVFESMFWGAKIVQEPAYEKTYNPEKAEKLDNDVYTALLK